MNEDQMLRMFIAAPLAPGIDRKLEAAQRDLSRARTRVTWVSPEKMHITIKFLGDVPVSEIDRISNLMAASMVGSRPTRLFLRGVSFFPNDHAPRVVKVAIDDETGMLAHAHEGLDRGLQDLGIPSDGRAFSPHLTLGRLRNTADIGSLVEIARNYQTTQFGSMDLSYLRLYASKLDRKGPSYAVLSEVDIPGI